MCDCCKGFCHSGAGTLPTASATFPRRRSTLPSRTRCTRSSSNVRPTATWWSSVRTLELGERLGPCLCASSTHWTSALHVWRMTHWPLASLVPSVSLMAWPMSTSRPSSPMVSVACTAALSYRVLASWSIVAVSSASMIHWSPSCLERMRDWSCRSF